MDHQKGHKRNRAGQMIEKFTSRHSFLIPDMYPISVPFPLHLVNKYYPQRQETFPEKLRAVRIEANCTQEALAARLEVAEDTVRNWENGRAFPCRKHLKTLATLCEGVFDGETALTGGAGA